MRILIPLFALAVLIPVSAFADIDSVISQSPVDMQIAFKVTTPDDCHGKYGDGNWIWDDGACVLDKYPPDTKTRFEKYTFAPPLKQIKAGVALADIQCNDGKTVVYKVDRMRAACVTLETENEIVFHRDWGLMRLAMPDSDVGMGLCLTYMGTWDENSRVCHGLKYPLLCSMAGGDVTDDGCSIPNTGVTPEDDISTVDVALHSTISIDVLKITFSDVEDSRCPLDVTCVWEGQVTAMLSIQSKSDTIDVSLSPGETDSHFAPYEITLIDVKPHPVTTQEPNYVVTIEISKLGTD